MPFITKQFKFCAAHKYWNNSWDYEKNYNNKHLIQYFNIIDIESIQIPNYITSVPTLVYNEELYTNERMYNLIDSVNQHHLRQNGNQQQQPNQYQQQNQQRQADTSNEIDPYKLYGFDNHKQYLFLKITFPSMSEYNQVRRIWTAPTVDDPVYVKKIKQSGVVKRMYYEEKTGKKMLNKIRKNH